ncbi:methylaspartate ammonia-lyase [Clostridiaceae bacterium OttesenSCG-928-D20]|nr:methylaspartate ammonia-lyase [Clostridiaceae bacterium OttesenSCG-928-D20]
MKIIKAIASGGKTGFFFDDQKAIKSGAKSDGSAYIGEPQTEGFSSVRQAGESISVMLILEDGQIALGDCAAVQYSGAGGRDPLFLASSFIPLLEKEVFPSFVGRELSGYRDLEKILEAIRIDGKPLHTAIKYGVSTALLDAVSKSRHKMMCEIIAEEYNTEICKNEIPIFTQSGDNRYDNADKMILKSASVLPHGLINNVSEKLGEGGEKLLEYVKWLVKRIGSLKVRADYMPIIHIDVYGTLGQLFGSNNYSAMADYLKTLEEASRPYQLRIEGPMDVGSRDAQIQALSSLTALLDKRGINVQLVADEWCNSLEDIRLFADNKAGHMVQIKTPDLGSVGNIAEANLYCRKKGIGAYQGGTCNETDVSARASVHIAMATSPDQMLAKPGMGVDEGYMIVYNEMQRILALLRAKGE